MKYEGVTSRMFASRIGFFNISLMGAKLEGAAYTRYADMSFALLCENNVTLQDLAGSWKRGLRRHEAYQLHAGYRRLGSQESRHHDAMSVRKYP